MWNSCKNHFCPRNFWRRFVIFWEPRIPERSVRWHETLGGGAGRADLAFLAVARGAPGMPGFAGIGAIRQHGSSFDGVGEVSAEHLITESLGDLVVADGNQHLHAM